VENGLRGRQGRGIGGNVEVGEERIYFLAKKIKNLF
jgi:hypothetical protein